MSAQLRKLFTISQASRMKKLGICLALEDINFQFSDSRVPLVYRDSGLSKDPRHYLGVDDLPIIVSYSFASLMLFLHLHTI
jgi:hypothetical protein